jgi:hypothetical protein
MARGRVNAPASGLMWAAKNGPSAQDQDGPASCRARLSRGAYSAALMASGLPRLRFTMRRFRAPR